MTPAVVQPFGFRCPRLFIGGTLVLHHFMQHAGKISFLSATH